jgi:dTMP kinase
VAFLNLPVDDAAKRGNFGVERYETKEFQRKVYANFLRLQDPRWKFIDATQSIDMIQSQLRQLAIQTIQVASRDPLTQLWSSPLTE